MLLFSYGDKAMGCVYLATNRINGKQYVGQTFNLDDRKKAHKRTALRGAMFAFYCAIRKYGFISFDWKTLKYREFLTKKKDKVWMNYWEKYYIKKLNTMSPNGYNLTTGGDGVVGIPHTEKWKSQMRAIHIGNKYGLGYKHTLEAKRKISDAGKGRKHSNVTKSKMSMAALGRVMSPETKEKLRLANIGKLHTPEAIEKIRVAGLGRKVTIETRNKLSNALKGRVFTTEWREKIGMASKRRKGYSRSAETCAKISASQKGRTFSLSTRLKMSITRTGRRMPLETRAKISMALKGRNHAVA
jgi:group I intron endonuclease